MALTTARTMILTLLLSTFVAFGLMTRAAYSKKIEISLGAFGPRPTVDIMLGENGPFTFILDTGAPGIVIDEGLADSLGIEITGMARMGAPGAQNPPERPLYAPQTIMLGPLSMEISRARGLKLSDMLPGENPPVGVLGFWELGPGLVRLDFEKGIMIIDPEGKLEESDTGVLKLEPNPPLPFPEFEIRVAGKPMKAHLDTGSPATFTLPLSSIKNLPLADEPEITGKANLVGGPREVWGATLEGSIEVGNYSEDEPFLSFVEGFPGVNVGSGFLRQTIVEIDFSNQLIRIIPKTRK